MGKTHPRAKPATADHAPARVRPLAPRDWPALEALFGERGACAGCWCMFWRAPYGGARWQADKGEPNRRKLEQLVTSGAPAGCLAWQGREAIGWVSVGPRESFAYFERSRALAPLAGEGVWSVTCFFVPARWRGRGVAGALLEGAIAVARRGGAARIEGYPAAVQRGAALPAAFAWTGVPALFERAGFTPRRHPRSGRTIYQLTL